MSEKLAKKSELADYEPLKSSDDNYVTDAEKVKLGNLSGTNHGDETTASILEKIGDGFTIDDSYINLTPQSVVSSLLLGGKITNGSKILPEYLPDALNGAGPPVNGTVGSVGLTISTPFANGDQITIYPDTESPVTFTKVASGAGPNEFTGTTAIEQRISLQNAISAYSFSGWVSVDVGINPARLVITVRQATDVSVTTATGTVWDTSSASGFVDGVFPDFNGQLYQNTTTEEFSIWNEVAGMWEAIGGNNSPSSPFYAGNHRLLFPKTRQWDADNFAQNQTPPINILNHGDSLAVSFGNEANARGGFPLVRNLAFRGYKLLHPSRGSVVSGTAVLANHAFAERNWLDGGHVWKLTGATTTDWILPDVNLHDFSANIIGVGYFKGTGSATMTVQVSHNAGSSWSTVGTIDTAAASNDFNYFQVNVNSAIPVQTRVRITTASGHTVHYVSVGIWSGNNTAGQNSGGYVITDMSWSGAIAASVNTEFEEIFAALKPQVCLITSNEIVGYGVGEDFDDMYAAAQLGNACDFVFVTNHPGGPDDWPGLPGVSIGEQFETQRGAIKAWCERNNESCIDFAESWQSFDRAVDLGYCLDADSTHPTTLGYQERNRFVGRVLADGLYFYQGNAIYLGTQGATLEEYQGTVTVKTGGRGGFLVDGGDYTTIRVKSQTEKTNHTAANLGYSGNATSNGSISFGAFEPGNFNFRNFLKASASGSISNSTLVLSSDWPLATNHKSANGIVPIPTDSVNSFYKLNGSSKWEQRNKTPDGIEHVVWTQP